MNKKWLQILKKLLFVNKGAQAVAIKVAICASTITVGTGMMVTVNHYVKKQEALKQVNLEESATKSIPGILGEEIGIQSVTDTEEYSTDMSQEIMNHTDGDGSHDAGEKASRSENNQKKTKAGEVTENEPFVPTLIEDIAPITPAAVKPILEKQVVSKKSATATSSDSHHSMQYENIDLEHVDIEEIPSFKIKDYGTVTPRTFAPDYEVQEKKEYTIMVYMCGSDLESNSYSATQDISSMISSCYDVSKVNIVILAGGSTAWYKNQVATGKGQSLGYICTTGKEKLAEGESIVNFSKYYKRIENYPTDGGTVDMGMPANLAGFINFSKRKFPANHYGLILWNHGGGVNGGICSDINFIDEKNSNEEYISNSHLETPELYQALKSSDFYKEGKKLDWLSCDACLMANFEVALALSPFGEYFVGSEECEVGGWNYEFLGTIAGNDSKFNLNDTKEICNTIAKAYVNQHTLTESCNQQDMNVIDLTKAVRTADTLEKLSKELIKYAQNHESTWISQMVKARNNAVSFGEDNSQDKAFDLVDYKGLLEQMKQNGIQVPFLEQNIKYLDDERPNSLVVFHHDNTNPKKNLNGISLYFPFHANYAKNYSEYDVIPSWTIFVEKFAHDYKKTANDIPLADAIDVTKTIYDTNTNRYLFYVKEGIWEEYQDTYWNVLAENIAGMFFSITRNATVDSEDDNQVVYAGAKTVANTITNLDSTNHVIEVFDDKYFTDESQKSLLLNGIPTKASYDKERGAWYVTLCIGFRDMDLLEARCYISNMNDFGKEITSIYKINNQTNEDGEESIDENNLISKKNEIEAVYVSYYKLNTQGENWNMDNNMKYSKAMQLPKDERGNTIFELFEQCRSDADGAALFLTNLAGNTYGMNAIKNSQSYKNYHPWETMPYGVDLSEALMDRCSYDADTGEYYLYCKGGCWPGYENSYWNVLQQELEEGNDEETLRFQEMAITRRGETEDGILPYASGKSVLVEPILDSEKQQIVFKDADYYCENDNTLYPLLFNGMPVYNEKDNDGVYFYADISMKPDNEKGYDSSYPNVKCYYVGDSNSTEKYVTDFKTADGENLIENEGMNDFINEIGAMQIYFNTYPIGKGLWTDRNEELQKSVRMEPSIITDENDNKWIVLESDSSSEADALTIVLKNKVNHIYSQSFAKVDSINENYRAWEDKIVRTILPGRRTVSIHSVSENSVSENSISENSVKDGFVSDNSEENSSSKVHLKKEDFVKEDSEEKPSDKTTSSDKILSEEAKKEDSKLEEQKKETFKTEELKIEEPEIEEPEIEEPDTKQS